MYILSAREALLERVATLGFKLGKSQSEIGDDSEVKRLAAVASGASRPSDARLSQSTINRLMQRARDLGIVSISIDRSFAIEPNEDPDKADRLRRAFALHSCTVVAVASPEPELLRTDPSYLDRPGPITDTPESVARVRTLLALANCAALKAKLSWTSGNHIGCGGGRTLCWFARAVRRNSPHTPNLTFTPLSGRLWVDDWHPTGLNLMERPIDSADAVHILSEAFEEEEGIRFSQNNLPLYGRAAHDSMQYGGCAVGTDGGWNWGLPPLTHAYLGVGNLKDDSHRLAVFLAQHEGETQSSDARRRTELVDALEKLRAIVAASEETLASPCDLGNRLFASLPLPTSLQEDSAAVKLESDIRRVTLMIDALNADAAIVTWLHLRRAANVHVIGGGPTKVSALWTLLLSSWFDARRCQMPGRDESPIVTDLTTDDVTAQQLLDAASRIQNDASLRDTYQRLCRLAGLTTNAE